MRKVIVFLSAVMLFIMTSCEETVQGDFTPELYCSYPLLNPYYVMDTLYCQDTLSMYYSSELNGYESADTISVGDSLIMRVTWYGVVNNLVSTSAVWDSTMMGLHFVINSDIEAALDKTKSDVDKCYLYFLTGYNSVTFPLYFYPKKSGVAKVSLKLETDSKFSPNGLILAFPIR